MLVAMLTMFVSRGRVLLGLLVLPVGVMVGRLHVMVCGRVVVRCCQHVVLDRGMLVLFGHDPPPKNESNGIARYAAITLSSARPS
jgi:hypothetical protein